MKKSQIKTMFIMFLILLVTLSVIYAVSTTLVSPVDNFVDDDGFLDLRATCAPTILTGEIWNVTNATLYHNVDGTWKANK